MANTIQEGVSAPLISAYSPGMASNKQVAVAPVQASSREEALARQLESRLTSRLSSIRQRLSGPVSAPEPSDNLGQQVDIFA